MAQPRRTTQQQAARPANDAPKAPAAAARSAAAAALMDDETEGSLVALDTDALGTITKNEIAMQLEAAHRWPRSITRFVEEATALATMTKATAQSCIFTLPARKGSDKPITGKSVRLAEMVASSWGNMHTGARIIDTGERDVTAQAIVWDLEKNLRMGFEVKRGIRTSSGQRYGDDMIRVTSMAAISIALRNAIFRVVPGALTNGIYDSAVLTATGVADNTFEQERDAIITFFVTGRWRVPIERILARLGVSKVEDITPDLLTMLIGFGQSVKAKECTVEEAFPPPGGAAQTPPARGKALDALVNANGKRKPEAAAEPAAAEPTPGEVQDALCKAVALDGSDEWNGAYRLEVITQWSPEQRREAMAWARAFADEKTDDADLPPRPAFTVIERQPGEDG